jgi:hypothetical protein
VLRLGSRRRPLSLLEARHALDCRTRRVVGRRLAAFAGVMMKGLRCGADFGWGIAKIAIGAGVPSKGKDHDE